MLKIIFPESIQNRKKAKNGTTKNEKKKNYCMRFTQCDKCNSIRLTKGVWMKNPSLQVA